MIRAFGACIVRALDRPLFIVRMAITYASKRKLPWQLVLSNVIAAVNYISATFDQQYLQTSFRQLLRGPTSCNSGSNNNGVKVAIARLHVRQLAENLGLLK